MNSSGEGFLCDYWAGRVVIAAAVLVLLLTGCNRTYYRQQADRDAYCLIEHGAIDPRWPLENYTIEPNPQSRFFDPANPDCPPMPPDDPTSHQLMHCVDGMKGWKHWHRNGDTPYVENPCWRASLPLDETGSLVLNRENVVPLALMQSREYQRQLEELYLSALDVSYERFLFDTHYFGGHSTFFTTDGRLRGLTGRESQGGRSSSTLDVENNATLRRTFATGGELVAGAANSIVWQFSGDGSYGTFSLLDFSVVQPLLRGAGRAVALENLTDSERALLANIRQMERYRRGFCGQILAGLSPGLSLSRRGMSISPPPSSSVGGGFFGLLEEEAQIRNQQANCDSLKDSLDMLQAAYDGGRLDNRYQVDLARQALLNGQSRLLTLRTSHQDRLDSYKIILGLPPDVPVRIQDDMLRQFDLMAPEMMDLRKAVDTYLYSLRDDKRPLPQDYLEQMAVLCKRSAEQAAVVRNDMQAMIEALPTRRKNLQRLASRPELQQGEIDPMVADVEQLDRRVEMLSKEYETIVAKLEATLAALEDHKAPEPAPLPDGQAAEGPLRDEKLEEQIGDLSSQLLQLSVLQALARLDTVTILPVDLEPEQAIAVACNNRLDWMNARAELVDRWRQIEIAADRLKAGLDVTFGGDVSTTDNNPLRFRGPAGRMRLGLAFDAPLTRLEERNAYREAQIRYEQARRDFMAFEDRISQNLRNTLRQIQLTQLNFEVRRAAVLVSITQVDLARIRLTRPPKSGETSAMNTTVGRDLVTAITSLLDAENAFLGVWVDYESHRMNLDFELGTMQLDDRGIWIDPGAITPATYGLGDKPEELPPIPPPLPEPFSTDPGEVVPAPLPETSLFAPPPLSGSSPAPSPPSVPSPPVGSEAWDESLLPLRRNGE